MYSNVLIVLYVKNVKNTEYQKKIHENRLIYTNKRLTLRTHGNNTFMFHPPKWSYDDASDTCIIFSCANSASNKIDK